MTRMRERLERLERSSELGVDVSKQLIEMDAVKWHRPEPGVLTWRDYQISRGPMALLELSSCHRNLGIGTLSELKSLAERDYAEREEMGEVEADKTVGFFCDMGHEWHADVSRIATYVCPICARTGKAAK